MKQMHLSYHIATLSLVFTILSAVSQEGHGADDPKLRTIPKTDSNTVTQTELEAAGGDEVFHRF